MSSTRKSRLVAWLGRARADLDHVAREIEHLPDDDPDNGVGAELDEVRARVEALESRVEVIEGKSGRTQR